ncbi:unnamed protein product [Camellia sinensis]
MNGVDEAVEVDEGPIEGVLAVGAMIDSDEDVAAATSLAGFSLKFKLGHQASQTMGYPDLPDSADTAMLDSDDFLRRFHHSLFKLHLSAPRPAVDSQSSRASPTCIFMKTSFRNQQSDPTDRCEIRLEDPSSGCPHSMAVLASSFPPSASIFAMNFIPTMTSIVDFLAGTGAPFMVNAYPYFAYRDNPNTINLQYALLGNATGVRDPKGYMYTNMLDAQIDSVRAAISALGFGNQTIQITVSESRWPSKGDSSEKTATPENAKTYNTRLIERAQSNKGTPMRPKDNIEIFVFALFNENKKKGGDSKRNFGIFNGDGSKVYDVDLSCEFCSGGGGL